MCKETEPLDQQILDMTSNVVSSYVARNKVAPTEVASIIHSVCSTLVGLGNQTAEVPQREKPAVPISKSLRHEYIVCLEDGKHLKMLKRYLMSRYGMTPDDYRRKWRLPADYPMVCPEYAKRRSDYAKQTGLGTSKMRQRAKR